MRFHASFERAKLTRALRFPSGQKEIHARFERARHALRMGGFYGALTESAPGTPKLGVPGTPKTGVDSDLAEPRISDPWERQARLKLTRKSEST